MDHLVIVSHKPSADKDIVNKLTLSLFNAGFRPPFSISASGFLRRRIGFDLVHFAPVLTFLVSFALDFAFPSPLLQVVWLLGLGARAPLAPAHCGKPFW